MVVGMQELIRAVIAGLVHNHSQLVAEVIAGEAVLVLGLPVPVVVVPGQAVHRLAAEEYHQGTAG